MPSSALFATNTTNITTASTTWYGAFNATGVGSIVSDTTELPAQMRFRDRGEGGAYTFKNLHVRVGVNSRTTNTVITFRKNGADSALTVTSAPGAGISRITDRTNTVSIVEGDSFNYSLTTGSGTGAFVAAGIGVELQTSGPVFSYICSNGSATATSARYWVPGGVLTNSTNETNMRARALEAFTASNLSIYLRTNGQASAGMEARFRNNGANGSQLIPAATIGTAASAWFEDTTNTDSVVSGNPFSFYTGVPTGGATVTVGHLGVRYKSSDPNTFSLMGNLSTIQLNAATTRYTPIIGAVLATPETSAQVETPLALTLSMLSLYVAGTNGSTTPVSVVSRKNEATGNQNITITAGTIATFFQDTTNTDSLAVTAGVGDRFDVMMSGATTGGVSINWIGVKASTPASSSGGARIMLLGVG